MNRPERDSESASVIKIELCRRHRGIVNDLSQRTDFGQPRKQTEIVSEFIFETVIGESVAGVAFRRYYYLLVYPVPVRDVARIGIVIRCNRRALLVAVLSLSVAIGVVSLRILLCLLLWLWLIGAVTVATDSVRLGVAPLILLFLLGLILLFWVKPDGDRAEE